MAKVKPRKSSVSARDRRVRRARGAREARRRLESEPAGGASRRGASLSQAAMSRTMFACDRSRRERSSRPRARRLLLGPHGARLPPAPQALEPSHHHTGRVPEPHELDQQLCDLRDALVLFKRVW